MALVRRFEKLELQRESIHGEADCTISAFMAPDGEKYFQIDTYGSKMREFKGKKSQSIQLNKDSAKALVKLLKEEFSI